MSLSSGKQQVDIELVDNFGKAFAGAKSAKIALTGLDGKDSKDVTKSAKFNKENNVATLTLNENETGKYKLTVTSDGYTISKILTVTDKLRVQSVSYQVTQSKKFPIELENTVIHPKTIDNMKTPSDDHFIHMAVSAKFSKSSV